VSCIETVSSYVEIVKNCVLVFSAIVAAYVALSGLKSWKEQLLWKTNHGLAKDLITASINVRSKASSLRLAANTFSEVEILHSKELTDEIENHSNFKIFHDFMNEHIKEFENAVTEFKAKGLEASFMWGGDLKKLHSDTLLLCAELNLAARARSFICGFPNSSSDSFENCRKLSQGRSLKYDLKSDDFSTYFEKRFEEFEDKIKPYFGNRS